MSFAEDMGHDIPDDFIYGGGSYSFRTRNDCTTSFGFADGNTIVNKTFIAIGCETKKAYLFQFEEGNAWVPKSRIRSLDMVAKKVYIPVWLRTNLQYI